MALDVSWNRTAGTLVATLKGRIDSANSMDCQAVLEAGIGPDEDHVVLNMAGVTYVSSAGLRVLLRLAKRLSAPGQTFALCELAGPVNEVVTVSGFGGIIPVHATLADAVGPATGQEGVPDDSAGSPDLSDPFDVNIIGENIADIANFTIEKHEFQNGSLAEGVRSEAFKAITDLLWEAVKRGQERRRRTLARLFKESDETLEEVVARHAV